MSLYFATQNPIKTLIQSPNHALGDYASVQYLHMWGENGVCPKFYCGYQLQALLHIKLYFQAHLLGRSVDIDKDK